METDERRLVGVSFEWYRSLGLDLELRYWRRGYVVTVIAHFDGNVIVPDEPVELPVNQRLIVKIEQDEGEVGSAEGSSLAWLVANAVDSEELPVDLAARHDRYLYGQQADDGI